MTNNPDTITISTSRVRDLWNAIPDNTGWKESFRELFGDKADELCPQPKPWEWIKTFIDADSAIDGLTHTSVVKYEKGPLKEVDAVMTALSRLQVICLAINGNELADGEHYEILPNQACSGFHIHFFDTDDNGMSPRTLRFASYEQAEHCLKWFEGTWKQYYGI